MMKITPLWVSCIFCLIVSCSDQIKHEHNFVETSDADISFRTEKERREMIASLESWTESNRFVQVTDNLVPRQIAYLLEPDLGNPRCFAKLTYQLSDNPDGNQFWIHIYLTTDRWGDKRAHERQEKITSKIHEALNSRFPTARTPRPDPIP